jgi:NAD+ synthase (glutamine-hydrolysing)
MLVESISSSTKCKIATCNLNQWALDFDGNLERVQESIRQAKKLGAKFRLGPELELSGYSCEDHFLELDTYIHCDQSLANILNSDLTDDILCEIGCPILHNSVRYNCRIFCLNRKIILMRPKMILADDGNYRERRFFTSWKSENYSSSEICEHKLSEILHKATNQTTVPFGVAILDLFDTSIASEVCEELWSPNSPHVPLMLAGAEIITNGSGSHHQLRKLGSRLDLMKSATAKCGGVYVYSNQQGCDGNRLYFDGSSLVCVNGELVSQGSQFSVTDVEVVTAVIDLNDIRSYRNGTASLQEQSSSTGSKIHRIDLKHFSLGMNGSLQFDNNVSLPIKERIHSPEEECALGPACWLWDYIRRSGASGLLLPLSGGADSASVAGIVRVMCKLVATAVCNGNQKVIDDIKRITKIEIPEVNLSLINDSTSIANNDDIILSLGDNFCNSILHTVYMGTSNSSIATKSRASKLAESIGSYHNFFNIDLLVSSVLTVFSTISSGKTPKYLTQGGSNDEDLALQNIQARLRMVMAYLCAQLLPWCRGKTGFLLVLGSANVDEALRGYMTKYDCSSADINPIGGISKGDLKNMLDWIACNYNVKVLNEISEAPPTVSLFIHYLFMILIFYIITFLKL